MPKSRESYRSGNSIASRRDTMTVGAVVALSYYLLGWVVCKRQGSNCATRQSTASHLAPPFYYTSTPSLLGPVLVPDIQMKAHPISTSSFHTLYIDCIPSDRDPN